VLEQNGQFGISIGHKDSDNLLPPQPRLPQRQNGVFFRNETLAWPPIVTGWRKT